MYSTEVMEIKGAYFQRPSRSDPEPPSALHPSVYTELFANLYVTEDFLTCF